MLEDLKNLPESEFFFWFGHGGYGSDGTTLHLATAQSYSDRNGIENINVGMVAVGISGFGAYWAIEPEFVTEFITLDDGLVYLAACYTGKNDSFADAFNDVGAETVFVNVGDASVQTFYTINMMGFILKYMSSRGDGIYRTAEEALALAKEDLDAWFTGNSSIEVQYGKNQYNVAMALVPYNSLDDYTNGAQNGTHIEYRGEGDYTICSCIRGKVDFGDNMTQDEISKILSYLSVNLVSEDGIYIDSVSVNDDSTFYFNDLDPDSTYMMTLQRGNSQIGETITVTTEKHRYVSALLTYSTIGLTGYVYDESDDPLEDVSVTISEVEESINTEYNYIVSTDEDGYYSVSVADGLPYVLTYEKDGYVTVETLYEPTDEQEDGENIKLEDIDLEQMKLMGTVVDAETGEGLSEVTVTAERDDAIEKYISVSGTTNSNGSFVVSIATEGDYNVTFGLEGYENVTVSAAMTQGSHTDMGTISLTVSDDEKMIPDDAFKWNGHYYYIYSDVCDTWEEAVEYCESLGGYIAVISSEEENEILFEYANESGLRSGGVYFGYTDNITEGEWIWASEEASSYTNWASNEPNSENNSEDYAEFYYKYTDGNWNDGDFASKRFICEWNLAGE